MPESICISHPFPKIFPARRYRRVKLKVTGTKLRANLLHRAGVWLAAFGSSHVDMYKAQAVDRTLCSLRHFVFSQLPSVPSFAGGSLGTSPLRKQCALCVRPYRVRPLTLAVGAEPRCRRSCRTSSAPLSSSSSMSARSCGSLSRATRDRSRWAYGSWSALSTNW